MSKNSKFLATLGIGFIAIFLGSLTAVFLVFSHIIKTTNVSYISVDSLFDNLSNFNSSNTSIFNDIDNQINKIFKEVQTLLPSFNFNAKLNLSNSPTIKTESTPNEYKITVNLKTLGEDENNVNLEIKDNIVNISAKYENKKDDRIISSSSFYQSFTLPEKIDSSKIKKVKQGSNLIITIPKVEPPKNSNTNENQALDKNFI
ncbi:MAG: hypothetical protein A2287_02530 [Candidatus Melainabacteria bacterium RIFOXYA12_FULL_32_12]|nr:MAG: hypothetical protein A2255_00365 [Candidatus Melainabacteria bacterium RIFOXYA2_FULL_32_9]OGI30970.1 MAG: hypothetical protein A2287_02530 [Candidatus Melainabacteria bacterium RIFOXYA12_FULL_32_12]